MPPKGVIEAAFAVDMALKFTLSSGSCTIDSFWAGLPRLASDRLTEMLRLWEEQQHAGQPPASRLPASAAGELPYGGGDQATDVPQAVGLLVTVVTQTASFVAVGVKLLAAGLDRRLEGCAAGKSVSIPCEEVLLQALASAAAALGGALRFQSDHPKLPPPPAAEPSGWSSAFLGMHNIVEACSCLLEALARLSTGTGSRTGGRGRRAAAAAGTAGVKGAGA